jgi:hypothetical protein
MELEDEKYEWEKNRNDRLVNKSGEKTWMELEDEKYELEMRNKRERIHNMKKKD